MKYENGTLGSRMKNYEFSTRRFISDYIEGDLDLGDDFQSRRETPYIMIRLDGKAFHTYTKGLKKPFDSLLQKAMIETAKYLCEEIQGAWLAYTQSDEITIVLGPKPNENSQIWYDGNIQKMVSVSASIATQKFNEIRFNQTNKFKPAFFDSRVFIVPNSVEVINNLIWRQQDAIRNSVAAVAQANFSPKELHGKNQKDQLEMLNAINIDWNNDFSLNEKNGTIIYKNIYILRMVQLEQNG